MKLDWIHQTAEQNVKAQPNAPRIETWFLVDTETADPKTSKLKPIGVIHRVENDNWLLWDLRDEKRPFSLPQRWDKTLVECKTKLIEWMTERK